MQNNVLILHNFVQIPILQMCDIEVNINLGTPTKRQLVSMH